MCMSVSAHVCVSVRQPHLLLPTSRFHCCPPLAELQLLQARSRPPPLGGVQVWRGLFFQTDTL